MKPLLLLHVHIPLQVSQRQLERENKTEMERTTGLQQLTNVPCIHAGVSPGHLRTAVIAFPLNCRRQRNSSVCLLKLKHG